MVIKDSRISRILTVDSIRLELETPLKWQRELEDSMESDPPKMPPARELREKIIAELVDLLEPTGAIQHRGRLYADLVNRERKASTALGHGIAVPHVRTQHARELAIGFGRTGYPVDWDAPDGGPVDPFFIMITPPYDDTVYNRLWRKMAGILRPERVREGFRNATDPGEIIRIIKMEE